MPAPWAWPLSQHIVLDLEVLSTIACAYSAWAEIRWFLEQPSNDKKADGRYHAELPLHHDGRSILLPICMYLVSIPDRVARRISVGDLW